VKLLLIDPLGAGLDIAMRAKAAGHEVRHFIRQTPKTDKIGRGLVDVVSDFTPWLNWAELILNTDNTRYLRDLDAHRLRSPKTAIISASQESALWELDRSVGQDVLRKAGVAVPPYQEFTNYDQAIAYVKKQMCRFVSKPSGDADKALSYVSKSPEDMVYMLERWKKAGKNQGPFILQEFIGGIEMAVGGWFGPGGWNRNWCENWEFKKLMDGDLGVNTGEQGTVLRYVKRSQLADKVLVPVTEALEKVGYVGYVDVNCIIDEQGTPWPLEFTMRPGWPCFNIQQALHEGDPIEWLMDLAQGRDARNTSTGLIALGVVLSIPDYPYSHITRKDVQGVPIYGLTPALWEHIHPCELMMGQAPQEQGGKITTAAMPVTAGDYVLVASATDETVYGAKQKAYRVLRRLRVPNSPMWRTDIGDRLAKQLPKLQAMGYALNLPFSMDQ
jgi:phosphoribosylamine--glycine ligase